MLILEVATGRAAGGFMPKITKTEIDKCLFKGAMYFLWDDETKGFCAMVYPSGTITYAFQYRTPEGRTRRYTIGKHGAVTADQARAIAKKLAADIVAGLNTDPSERKQERRHALTVSELLDRYMASAKFAEKSDSTKATDLSRIERHLKPLAGRVIADKLTTEQIRRMFADIRDGKTASDIKTGLRGRAITTGGEGTARKAVRILRAVLNWGVEQGYLKNNPATGVKVGVDGTRETILHEQEQYRRLFDTLNTMEQERRIRSEVADIIRVIALTGARRKEIAALRWSHVDIRRGLLVLPPDSHKTGKKTGKPREIGLPATAQAIIARRTQGKPDDYVFPPTSGNNPIDLTRQWRGVRKEANLPDDIGLHGLRHSLASMMAVQGAQAAEIMVTLGHRDLSTSQKYVHWAQDAKAALVERHTAGISAALEGREKAEVVTITDWKKKR